MEDTPAGTYRYRNLQGEHVTGEIWSMGPLPKTLWVLGPDGPVVVHVDHHDQRRYAVPVYKPHMHMWVGDSPDGFGVLCTSPMDFRRKTNPVGKARWDALVAKQLAPVRDDDAMALPWNWDLTYEFPSAA